MDKFHKLMTSTCCLSEEPLRKERDHLADLGVEGKIMLKGS
jgi:hypothetical protein